MSDIQLTIDEPSKTDIFRVYRANHPETLAFDAPSKVAGPYQSFDPQNINILQQSEIWKPVSIVPMLTGPAKVSAATRQMTMVCDANEMLAMNNFEAAEDILGRKLTDEEKQSKLIADHWAPKEERAARDAEFEDLKELSRLSRKRYEASLAKYAAASTKAAKDAALALAERLREKAAADLEEFIAAAIANKKEEDDTLAEFLNMDWSSDDSLKPKDITLAVNQSLIPLPGSNNGSDNGSIAPTVVQGSSSAKKAKDDDSKSIASTVLAPTHGVTTLYVFPWLNKPKNPLKKDYQARAADLVDNCPELELILKGHDKSKTKAELEMMVSAAEDELARKTAEVTGKKQAKNIAEAAKQAQSSGDGSSSSSSVPVPLAGNGVSLFTGLRKMKNHMDYVRFGPRFLIDLKRLKDKSEFSLAYPKSGQKPNNIRNSILTPALKEVVLAYLEGQPQDTTDLNDKEMGWLKLVWRETGLAKPKPKLKIFSKKYKGKAKLKARLKVLMGEHLAGNDNPEVLTEASSIVDQLEERKWISENDIINSRRFISGE